MLNLNPALRSQLRAKAHTLHPVVMVAEAGLTPPVMHEIDVNLISHELIKIRIFNDDRTQREEMLKEICTQLGASPVQHIGKILVIYRQANESPEKPATGTRARRKKRPTKRSFQGGN